MSSFYRYAPAVRIATVGDSLAGQVDGNWQIKLYRRLIANSKAQIHFVGTDNGPPPIWTNPYPGQRIDQINTNITTIVLPNHDPDLMIVMAGTNDALQSASSATMLTRATTLLTAAFTASPRVRIIFAKPPPLSLAGAGVTQAKIDELAAFVAGLSAAVDAAVPNKLVSVVDCWTGFNINTMLYDGIHQNSLGGDFFVDAMLGAGTGFLETYGHQSDSTSI